MYLYHNIENDLVIDVNQIYHRQQIIQQMKHRFSTFGYREIHTSTFEPYDLYVHMNGTVNHQEMMKTIDNTGKVLVLRPDITIPLTQQIAAHNKKIHEDLRYFYVLDVFRQGQETKDNRESTQAGVEYFGNPSPEADAEIIALAIQLLQDIELKNVKIELGHAGFFEQLIYEMKLEKQDLQELKQYIEAKNITEIEQLLQRLSIHEDMKQIVTSLPFLYGAPREVIQKAKKLPLRPKMLHTLDNIAEIFLLLEAYGVAQHMVVDLSLINHMDYYSDMIFQGFIETVGKPIIMGGRYNTLANQFDAEIPAIGFACDLDVLAENIAQSTVPEIKALDIGLLYDNTRKKDGLTVASLLRNEGFQVVTYPYETVETKVPEAIYTLLVVNDSYTLQTKTSKTSFQTIESLVGFLQKERN